LANITFTCSVNINDISGGGGIDETATFLSPVYVVPGIATLSLICLTCLSLPLVIYSFKRADVLKRITMKINNNWMFYSVIGFYYIILCIFSYAFAYFLGSLLI
jgi:hypothetical protein